MGKSDFLDLWFPIFDPSDAWDPSASTIPFAILGRKKISRLWRGGTSDLMVCLTYFQVSSQNMFMFQTCVSLDMIKEIELIRHENKIRPSSNIH